jgi:5'-nucleotidase
MNNTAEVLQKAVDELTAAGVNKIIVLSHIGYTSDQDLAKTIHGVDVIVGGHSHTLLANFDTRAQGPYPTVVKDSTGKNVLVVQAGEYEQYLGRLDVVFDGNGELKSWSGDTIFLSHYLTPDPQIAALVAGLNKPIDALTKQVIGSSAVDLNGDRKVCRFAECSMGNLITDAMRADTGAQIALENGGGIRASMAAGDITLGDVLNVLPFGNLVSTFKLKGADLKTVLENSVSRVDAEEGTGRFLQVSGLRFTFDAKQPVGSRVVSVEVLDASGQYKTLKEDEIYTVATNDFTREGGDDNTVLKEKAIDAYDYGRPLDQVLADYFRAHSPVNTAIEGRITAK